MDSEAWQTVRRIFDAALELLPEERDAFIDQQCGDDEELLAEVRAMLSSARLSQALGVEAQLASVQTPEPLPSRVGERFGSWRLTRRIGRGGMGDVYLAERADDQYEQTAAVKVVRSGALGAEAVRRFRAERQILARLVHPHIARLLDGGVAPTGEPYLVMQAIDGRPITEYCDANRLDVDERLRLFRTVCSAVQFAHQNLVVHRDLKPSNILVTESGDVKLLDFGIAKLQDPEASDAPQRTVAEMRLLTPEYAAPEQILGEPVTTATDVYGLGVLLYELLAGQGPHTSHGTTRREQEDAVLRGDATRPSSLLTGRKLVERARMLGMWPAELKRRVRGDLERIIMKALRSEPERRYGTAEALADDVKRYLEHMPVSARPDTIGYRLGRFLRRRRIEVAAAGAILIMLIGFGVVTSSQAKTVAAERDLAQGERDRAEEVIQVLVDMFEASAPTGGERLDTLRIGEFLQASEDSVLTRLEDRPELRIRLQQVLGNVYAVRGQNAKAVEILSNAAEDQLALAGADSMYAALLVDLGTVDYALYGPQAEERLREALAVQEDLFQEPHGQIARALQNLAAVLDDPDERRGLLDRSLSMSSRLLEADSDPDEQDVWNLALAYNQLGVDYYRTGEDREAVERLSESLTLLESIRASDHPDVLAVKANLAAMMNRAERHAEAEAVLRELLLAQESMSTGATLPRAIALGNLGTTLYFQGDLVQAGVLVDSAIAMHEEVLGDTHTRIANLKRTRAFIHGAGGAYESSRALLDDALAIQVAFDGGASVRTATLEAQRAWYWLPEGAVDRAVDEATTALNALLARIPSGDAAQIATAREVLGDALMEIGEPAQALPEYERALEIRLAQRGAESRARALNEARVGMALAALGRLEEARERLESVVERLRSDVLAPYQRDRVERAWARVAP